MHTAIELPVFVSRPPGPGSSWSVRALFRPALSAQAPTFERALRSCAKRIRRQYARCVVDRDSLPELQWLSFNPRLHAETQQLDLTVHKRRQAVRMTVLRFRTGRLDWLCLPRVDNLLIGVDPDATAATRIGALQAALDRWSRSKRQEGESLEPESLARRRGDFVSTLRVTLDLQPGRFAIDAPEWLGQRAGLSQRRVFHGAIELEKVAQDLQERHPERLQRALGEPPHLRRVSEAIFTGEPAAIAIIGAPGSGRTTLLHEALGRVLDVERSHPERVQKVWHLDPTRVVAGMSIIGDWQRRVDAILQHLTSRLQASHGIARQDVLFIDNPVALCRVGRSAASELSLSTVLRPWIERRALPVVVEATPEEWSRLEELDRPFADLFERIRVAPLARSRALEALLHRRDRHERAGRSIEVGALRQLVELEDRYPSERELPGSVIDRLDTVCARQTGTIDEEAVNRTFASQTGLRPEVTGLSADQPAWSPAELRARVSRRLIGQPAAVDALCDVMETFRTGLSAPRRPVGSLFFIGPTGVGKTEAAKVLTDLLYTSEDALIRIDMNEYADPGAPQRLVGDLLRPEGVLSARVRHRPYSVLLLDELEKAHTTVHDLLLQVLDEGRLTDGLGRRVDFSRCIILLTSNVGAREAGRSVGFDGGRRGADASYSAALKRVFRPELLNRIDRRVVFGPLEPSHIVHIAHLQIDRLLLREGLRRRVAVLTIADSALAALARSGHNRELGARSLKRTLERQLVGPLARYLLGVPSAEPVATAGTDPRPLPIVIDTRVEGSKVSLIPRRLDRPELHTRTPLRAVLEGCTPDELVPWVVDQLREAVYALADLDRSAASASPDGVQVPKGMSLTGKLRHSIEQLEALAPEEPGIELTAAALRGGLGGGGARSSRTKKRWGWNVPLTRWDLGSHEEVQALLRSCRSTPSTAVDHGTLGEEVRRALARLLVARATLLERPPACALRLTGIGRATPQQAAFIELLCTAWSCLGSRDVTRHDPLLVFERPDLFELLQSERGIHLCIPSDGSPTGVEVQLVPLPVPTPPLAEIHARLDAEPVPPLLRRMFIAEALPAEGVPAEGILVDFATDKGRWVSEAWRMAEWIGELLADQLEGPMRLPEPPKEVDP